MRRGTFKTTFGVLLEVLPNLHHLFFGKKILLAVVVVVVEFEAPWRFPLLSPMQQRRPRHLLNHTLCRRQMKVSPPFDQERSFLRSASCSERVVFGTFCHPETQRHFGMNFKSDEWGPDRGFHTGPHSQADGWFGEESEVA